MNTASFPASLRSMMHGLVDYAGLFPPATLDMATAISNYAYYRQGPDAWMLGRFIVPASRLEELGAAAGTLFETAPPFRLSVLTSGGTTSDEFLDHIEVAMSQIGAFKEQHGDRVEIDFLETPLPTDVLDTLNLQDDGRLLTHLTERTTALSEALIFLEVSPSERWAERVALAIEAIAAHNQQAGNNALALKIRCGGTPDPTFPSTEQLAFVLDLCQAARVPLKATAGLHHPVRHYDSKSNRLMHGFFNLFGAGMLAWTHGLSMNSLVQIIRDQNESSFRFDEEGFAWNQCGLTTAEINLLRRDAFISYGSCSFNEPVEDLRALGYESESSLPPVGS